MFSLGRVIPTVSRFTASLSHLAPLSTVLPSKAIVSYQIVTRPIATSTTVWKKKEIIDGLPTEDEKKTIKQSQADGSTEPKDTDVSKISLLSWNIDGLDRNNRSERMLEVYKTISRINSDFVFLQEVVDPFVDKVMQLDNYNFHFSDRSSMYFTAILVSNLFSVRNHEVIHYENSEMDRTLQIVEGTLGPYHVFLLTSHLESLKDSKYSTKRKRQLAQCFDKIDSISKEYPNAIIIFGGDLNLRDKELCALPAGFADAWQAAGAPESDQFTYDTTENTNKYNNFKARCRFDRIYFKTPTFVKVSFELMGKQLIPESNCYPSDHWAIHVTFSKK